MPYTLAAAAAACGVNKSTVLRVIKAGKITGTKDEHGEWHVEPAELHRVYPPVADQVAPLGLAHGSPG
jgi:predicted site-specific integrase-resolvase